jgi:integrase
VRTVKTASISMAALERHLELFPPVEVEIRDRTNPDRRKHRIWIARLSSDRVGAVRCTVQAGWVSGYRPRKQRGFPKGVGPHCLRHYFTTRLIHQGAGVKRVQLAPGHATPTTPLNTYVGEWPDTDQETSAIMDAALGQVPRMCPPAGRLR